LATFEIVKTLPKVNNHPIGKNLPNLVNRILTEKGDPSIRGNQNSPIFDEVQPGRCRISGTLELWRQRSQDKTWVYKIQFFIFFLAGEGLSSSFMYVFRHIFFLRGSVRRSPFFVAIGCTSM
jgi:hypothetical protein